MIMFISLNSLYYSEIRLRITATLSDFHAVRILQGPIFIPPIPMSQ